MTYTQFIETALKNDGASILCKYHRAKCLRWQKWIIVLTLPTALII